MKQMNQWLMMGAVVLALYGTMTGCKDNAGQPVQGTMEYASDKGAPPEAVVDLAKQLVPTDDRLETVLEDKASGVAVLSLLRCSDEASSEGYGMLIVKGDVVTALPQVRHGNMPRARFDAAAGDLWIVGSDAEGTGMLLERPYRLRFGDDGYAEVVAEVNPYDIQQAFCEKLTYSVSGQDITFYSDGQPLVTVTNHIEDMGDMMDDAIYIGEQITYSIDGTLTVHVTPGVDFVTGKVLLYDDMPTLSATVTIDEDGNGITLGNITVDNQ